MRSCPLILVATLALAACETTNSKNWTGGDSTPFETAERTCEDQAANISEQENRSDFFIGCMQALGWNPKPETDPDI